MALWRISDNNPERIPETRFKDEQLLEENLEDWIAEQPDILGEPLLVIGRQVQIPDTKDRLDLLALDPQGNAVIVELKRGTLKDPVDIQALRYASYIAKWRFGEFESVARSHLGRLGDRGFNFNEIFEAFCEEALGEAVGDINSDQRIIIAGGSVREKLGSVALWLREHTVDIKLIEVRAYRSEDGILIEPKVLVPLEVSRFMDVGSGRPEASPWRTDGRVWHLEKRCSQQTKGMLLALETVLDETVDADGPYWNQKYYVAFRRNNFNWLRIITRPTALGLNFHVRKGAFRTLDVAQALGIVEFDSDESYSEKLNLPSSVLIETVGEDRDRIRIRAKEDFGIESGAFRDFLVDAFEASAK